ncbi:MAG: ribosome silencing factor [Myxococcota bacterium]
MTETSSATQLTDLTRSLAQTLIDKKASNIRVLELSELVSYCDRVILCTGNSSRHVRAIAEAGVQTAKQNGIIPLGVEGQGVDQWILIDLNDIIIHVFDSSVRSSYDLDSLWITAPEVSLESMGIDLPEDPDSDSDETPYFVL